MAKIQFIPPRDPVQETGRLRLEFQDGESFEIDVADIEHDDQRSAIQNFAFHVESEPRRLEYLQRYPLSEGQHNYERIRSEQRDDFDDWYLRRRGSKERYAGIDESTLRDWRRHR